MIAANVEMKTAKKLIIKRINSANNKSNKDNMHTRRNPLESDVKPAPLYILDVTCCLTRSAKYERIYPIC